MKRVVMIGPSPAARGGMATVIGTLLQHGYAQPGIYEFLATHVDGGKIAKLVAAAGALVRFAALLLTGQVAVLHAHVASGVSFWRKAPFIALAQMAGCPVIFHLHGAEFRIFVEQRLKGWRKKLAFTLMRHCTCALVLSGDAEDLLRNQVGLDRVEVFPNPVAMDGPPHHGDRSGDILFLGQIGERKGAFDLIASFVGVREVLPASRLVLAGNGDLDRAKDLATKLGLADAVVFAGWIGPGERAQWLSRAGVFVLPSYNEQAPMSILEAMAAGIPVVASKVAAIPEMLEQGAAGVLVNAGDVPGLQEAIVGLLSDPARALGIAVRASRRVSEFYAADVVLRRLRQRYQELSA